MSELRAPSTIPARATLFDVARLAGVSIQTVSAVVNDKPGISEPTQVRVRNAINELNYHPNILASSLRARKSFTIGVIVPSITNPYFPEFVRGVEDVAHAHGFSLFLCNSDNQSDKELAYLQLLRRYAIAGFIDACYMENGRCIDTLIDLIEHGVPVVLLGNLRIHPKAVIVDSKNKEGGHAAVTHLFELGHRRIGVIKPPPTIVGLDRLKGFESGFHDHGLPILDEYWVEGGFDVSHGEAGIQQLLQLPQPPTAVIAANDLVAIGAATALRRLGKRVPEDVSIIGYDNIRMAELYDPALTTISQPVYDMGVAAMRAIIRRIEDRSLVGAKRDFTPRLIVRASTQPLNPNKIGRGSARRQSTGSSR
jgi:DNA-binding LacI/PurR family transcriptional regulator